MQLKRKLGDFPISEVSGAWGTAPIASGLTARLLRVLVGFQRKLSTWILHKNLNLAYNYNMIIMNLYLLLCKDYSCFNYSIFLLVILYQ